MHQQAYATGEPYQMIERIVRPDGEVRYLSSNGEVIMDADGTPVRMRGTCIDITDRVLADRERERIAARFRGLVESAPDAILVLDDEGRVVEANPRAHELLGGEPRGHRIREILPGWPDTAPSAVRASGLDGQELVLDVTTVAVKPRTTRTTAAEPTTRRGLFLRDAGAARARGDGRQARRGPAAPAPGTGDQRQRRAGLVAAVYALEQGRGRGSAAYLGAPSPRRGR